MEMCCKKNKKIEDSEKKYTLLFYFYGIFLEKNWKNGTNIYYGLEEKIS